MIVENIITFIAIIAVKLITVICFAAFLWLSHAFVSAMYSEHIASRVSIIASRVSIVVVPTIITTLAFTFLLC